MRVVAASSVLVLGALALPVAATAAAVDEQDIFIATTDGSSYGLLGTLTTSMPNVAVSFLGTVPVFDIAPGDVTVTAADYDASTGNAAVLLSAETSGGSFVCGIAAVSGADGAPVGEPLPFIDQASGDPWAFDSECTSLDIISDQLASAAESLLPAAASSPSPLDPAGKALSGAFVGVADGAFFAIDLTTGDVSNAGVVGDFNGEPLEALTVMSVGEGPTRIVYLALAFGDDIVAWAGDFGEMLLPEPAVGTVVGLDADVNGVLWYTWQLGGETGLTAVLPTENPLTTSAPAAASELAPTSLRPAAGEVLTVFALTLNNASVMAEAVTVVPAGFGGVGSGNELAETGADAGVVTTLAIIAAVLGGLGIALIVVRIVMKRRGSTER